MNREMLRKSVEEIVDNILEKNSESKESEESIQKSESATTRSESRPENGGKDDYRSGSPHTEELDMMGQSKKAEVNKTEGESEKDVSKAEDEDEEEDEKKAKKNYKKGMKKSEQGNEDDSESDEKDSQDVKKSGGENQESSQEAGSENEIGKLSDEEVELVKAWREHKEGEDEEKVAKTEKPSQGSEELIKAFKEENQELKKSLESQNEMIKSLQEKVEKISTQPAYDKRGLDRLETVEKGGEEAQTPELSKSQISDKLLELQQSGKGVTSHHIAEFEATNTISDPGVKKMVMDSFKN